VSFHIAAGYVLIMTPGRNIQRCPLTGHPAKYIDPHTGVPFASVHAYRTLLAVLAHDFVWSNTYTCYLGQAGE
jgi:hypothetical protein